MSRAKLSKELSKRATGKTINILDDEPTTVLHFRNREAVGGAASACGRVHYGRRDRAQSGVIKTADWAIDLCPEGGGGRVVAQPPKQLSVQLLPALDGGKNASFVLDLQA